jgi:outer membrane protein assembly factor BamB
MNKMTNSTKHDTSFAGTERRKHAAVLPHPDPLPLGEGETQPALVTRSGVSSSARRRACSLSQRERVGVREKACAFSGSKFNKQGLLRPHLLVCGLLSVVFSLTSAAADWPGFRGPNRNGTIAGPLNLRAGEPVKVWETDVGNGQAACAVAGGRLYTFSTGPKDHIYCLDAGTGARVWSRRIDTWFAGATPAVEGGRVYVLASRKEPTVYCCDAANGEILWRREFPAPAQERHYGHAGSPVLWRNLVFLNVGGGVALDRATGQPAWLHEGFPGLATPVVFQWKGVECVAFFGGDQLIVREALTGKERFRVPWKTELAVNACDPIVLGERVFLCSDYGKGRALYDFASGKPELRWERGQGNGHSFSSGFVLGGELYFFGRGRFACLDLESGDPRWEWPGSGSAIAIGDHVIGPRAAALVQRRDAGDEKRACLRERPPVLPQREGPARLLADW